jgi:hypothetical protein
LGGAWCTRGFGFALVAGRCWGGADVGVLTTGRDGGVVVPWELDELVEVPVVLGGGGGATTRAAGAGSGPSLDGALTGGRSGPAA